MENDIERPKSSIKPTKLALVVLWLVVGGAVVGNLGQALTIISGRALGSFGGIDGRLPISLLPQLLHAELRGGGTGYLADAPMWLRIMCASPLVANSITVLLAALWTAAIIRKISIGRPFDFEVTRGWKWLSAVLIIGGSIQGLLDAAAGRGIKALATPNGASDGFPLGADYTEISVALPYWPILMMLLGVIAVALAIAFRSGARLESEVEGIV